MRQGRTRADTTPLLRPDRARESQVVAEQGRSGKWGESLRLERGRPIGRSSLCVIDVSCHVREAILSIRIMSSFTPSGVLYMGYHRSSNHPPSALPIPVLLLR